MISKLTKNLFGSYLDLNKWESLFSTSKFQNDAKMTHPNKYLWYIKERQEENSEYLKDMRKIPSPLLPSKIFTFASNIMESINQSMEVLLHLKLGIR